ncbi:MAG: beta-ketoacyl synthase N-terminal-like domain-containing protein [Thermodesulfobacteriota bacterium]
MTNNATIAAAGVVTALGDLEDTWQGLLAGRSAISEKGLDDDLAKWPAALVPDLDGELGGHKRLDQLLDRLIDDLPALSENTRLVAATTKSASDELLNLPPDQWQAQPWDLAGIIAGKAGTAGRQVTISAACASGTLALINGVQQITNGEAQAVLVVGVDLVSRFVQAGFSRLQALSRQGARPFDKDRDGLSLGEGAGYILFKREAAPFLRVGGWGAACDARHITAPCRQASGLIKAIGQTIGGGSRKVGAINAHGTGTVYNDAMEMVAIDQVFEGRIPVHSVKGSIGHTLGAAGVIEAALALKALREGVIPPTAGLGVPEKERWRVSGEKKQLLEHPSILTCNSGFGGINAALLFEHDTGQ